MVLEKKSVLLLFLPDHHSYFYPSTKVFTRPNDGWTGLCIKLRWLNSLIKDPHLATGFQLTINDYLINDHVRVSYSAKWATKFHASHQQCRERSQSAAGSDYDALLSPTQYLVVRKCYNSALNHRQMSYWLFCTSGLVHNSHDSSVYKTDRFYVSPTDCLTEAMRCLMLWSVVSHTWDHNAKFGHWLYSTHLSDYTLDIYLTHEFICL